MASRPVDVDAIVRGATEVAVAQATRPSDRMTLTADPVGRLRGEPGSPGGNLTGPAIDVTPTSPVSASRRRTRSTGLSGGRPRDPPSRRPTGRASAPPSARPPSARSSSGSGGPRRRARPDPGAYDGCRVPVIATVRGGRHHGLRLGTGCRGLRHIEAFAGPCSATAGSEPGGHLPQAGAAGRRAAARVPRGPAPYAGRAGRRARYAAQIRRHSAGVRPGAPAAC